MSLGLAGAVGVYGMKWAWPVCKSVAISLVWVKAESINRLRGR